MNESRFARLSRSGKNIDSKDVLLWLLLLVLISGLFFFFSFQKPAALSTSQHLQTETTTLLQHGLGARIHPL